MARPSLLFLDEVTSGLDEQTDREMMELFRQVADNGKTVVCITHSLANVEATCHLVIILTEGGRLAFLGTPAEARKYFGIDRLGNVYKKLLERDPEDWQAAFRANPLYAHYIRDRLPTAPEDGKTHGKRGPAPVRDPAKPVRQAWVLTRRYVSIWRGDWMAGVAVLGQALLVAVLLGTVFGRFGVADGMDPTELAEHTQRAVNLLFLLNVSCFWFGCNTAAKELVKERVIYTRKHRFNLHIDSYLASKLAVLLLIVFVQVTLLFGIVQLWCATPVLGVGQWCVLLADAVAGTGLGLLISAVAGSEDVAVALVPIAVLPQIILAGVIVKLTGVGKVLAVGVITVRWAEQALESLFAASDLALIDRERDGYFVPLAMVVAHGAAFAVAALVTLRLREKRQQG